MAKFLDNTEFNGVDSTYNGVISPKNDLAQGIKQIVEILEENGMPKYIVDGILKTFGVKVTFNGAEQSELAFDSNPQVQINAINAFLAILEGNVNDLDSTKQDKDVALIRVNVGIQDLVHNGTFDLTPDQMTRLTPNVAVALEVTDNVSGIHRVFIRTRLSADAGMLTFVESTDMGSKKAPSINEIEISVATRKATYMEMALQPRLTQIDLDNIASIPQKQNSTDQTLSTTDKTIVGAINEVNNGANALRDKSPQAVGGRLGYNSQVMVSNVGFIMALNDEDGDMHRYPIDLLPSQNNEFGKWDGNNHVDITGNEYICPSNGYVSVAWRKATSDDAFITVYVDGMIEGSDAPKIAGESLNRTRYINMRVFSGQKVVIQRQNVQDFNNTSTYARFYPTEA